MKNSSANLKKTPKKILDAAVQLFADHGFKGASIRNIAKLTGMTISSIYYYFGSKHGLLLAVLEHTAKGLLTDLQQVTKHEMEPIERFKNLVSVHLDRIAAHKNEAKVFFFDDLILSPKGNKINREFQREVLSIYKSELNRLRLAGVIKNRDLTILALNILGAINWHLRWYRKNGRLSMEEIKSETLQFLLNGLFEDAALLTGKQKRLRGTRVLQTKSSLRSSSSRPAIPT